VKEEKKCKSGGSEDDVKKDKISEQSAAATATKRKVCLLFVNKLQYPTMSSSL
jgi:hypothetical protein